MMVMPVVALWKKVHNDDGLHDRGCFTLKNSRRQPGLSGPKSANNGHPARFDATPRP
jgi:hypothetical protein